MSFKLSKEFKPSGDQPNAVKKLVDQYKKKYKNQVLLGVTGSGKTFTVANAIKQLKKPTLIMAPNKTLAAQLYGEMKGFFPENAVEYFVSYYDYYQPEAYVPKSDIYIEKESSINEQIDRMRHSATRSLFERQDVIIVASVSCIYGIGDSDTYSSLTINLRKKQIINRNELIGKFVELQYQRNNIELRRGNFRVKGDVIEIFPAHYEDQAWKISFFDNEIEKIIEFDPLTGKKNADLESIKIYANSHYVTTKPTIKTAIETIRKELDERVDYFKSHKKFLEAQRIEERTNFDLEMIQSTGTCNGIENYSRHLTHRLPGEPPPTLFEYFPKDSLLIVDESHVSVPQIHGMFKGDRSRKETLSEFGFRLPSCLDNRPLKFEEWDATRPDTIFVSATPAEWELKKSKGRLVEQIIRPTGLIDPECEIRPASSQVDDLIGECKKIAKKKQRALVTTLTKRMAEDLTDYMNEAGINVQYMHSDIDTIDRIRIITELREGKFDVLVGINLLREGLDIPECSLVAILDADKEGFLRSRTSLIQTIGRAARNIEGKVILYADIETKSITQAIEETTRRREKQKIFNKKNNITPESIRKNINNILDSVYEKDHVTIGNRNLEYQETVSVKKQIKELEKEMLEAASQLEFEEAAKLRDKIKRIEVGNLGIISTNFLKN